MTEHDDETIDYSDIPPTEARRRVYRDMHGRMPHWPDCTFTFSASTDDAQSLHVFLAEMQEIDPESRSVQSQKKMLDELHTLQAVAETNSKSCEGDPTRQRGQT